MSQHGWYPDAQPPVRDSGRVANLIHLLVSLGGWIVFGVFWVRVFYRTPPAESAFGVLVVGILLVVSVSLTVAWIRHNLILSDRYRGRRAAPPEVRPRWTHDTLGRPLRGPDWETLQNAPRVEIGVDEGAGEKTYRALAG